MNRDAYVLVFYDASEGEPDDLENMPTSPIVIKRMCDELIDEHPLVDGANALSRKDAMIRDEGLVAVANVDITKMTWGDWLKVAYDPNTPTDGLYLVKVVDEDIEQINDQYRSGR